MDANNDDERFDLKEMKRDYEGKELLLRQVAEKHGVSPTTLRRIRAEHGWRMRQPRRIDRHDLIERLFRLLDKQIRDVETSVTEDDKDQAAILGRLVTTLDKLIAIKDAEGAKHATPRRSSKAMMMLRSKIAERIAQFAQP